MAPEPTGILMMKILIAGIGNVLRGDDGFGIRVIEALSKDARVTADVDLYEAGIAGIGLVQELINGYDALIMVDAVDQGSRPGTLFILDPIVPEVNGPEVNGPEVNGPEVNGPEVNGPEVNGIDAIELHQSIADAHFTEPSKVMLLARALNVCPPQVFIVGCQPGCVEDLIERLDPAVERAVPLAVDRILELIETLKQSVRISQG